MEELKKLLISQGANLVGFADLDSINKEMPFGISVAVKLSPELIKSIDHGPNMFYFNEFHRINDLLDKIVSNGAEYLVKNGFRAIAQTKAIVKFNDNYESDLPHKTIGTRAGLGWIGKCGLLVTNEYGSGIRISSILTNAKLNCSEPINESYCGDCTECVKFCPGEAVSGKLWNIKINRNELLDVKKCAKTAKALTKEKINKEAIICGKCFVVCPFTMKYVNS